MFTNLPAPSLSARIITIVVAIAWLTIGVLEVISPKGWDATFGIPLKSEDGLSFVRAVGTRNIALSLIAIFAALTGMRGALAAVFAAIALIAALDFYVVSTAVGAAHALKHAFFVLLMAGISAWVAFSRNVER
jgi:hypothetical protein